MNLPVASLRRVFPYVAVGGVVVTATAAAQDATRVVHEFATFLADEGPTNPDLPPLESPGLAAEVEDPSAPARFGVDGPAGDESGYEPGVRNGPFDPRDPAALDDATGPEGQLRYVEVFDPSVAPWKRGLARDAVIDVDGEPVLVVSSDATRPVPIGAPLRGDAVRFTADLEVVLRSEVPIAIPSVSPEMTVDRIVAEPPVAVRIVRDAADNFFVIADYDGVVRLRFDAGAAPEYFAGPPPGARPARRDGDFPASLVPIADQVLTRIGVTPLSDPGQALDALRTWYAAFEAAEFRDQPRSRSLWLDLTSLQLGVCRHRAMGFVAAAQALGFEARYVHNEAHAFAEVRAETGEWWRVDLGGAAEGLTVVGRDGERLPAGGEGPNSPYPQDAAAPAAARPDPAGSDAAPRDGTGTGGTPGNGPAGDFAPVTLADLRAPAPDSGGAAMQVASRIELELAASQGFVGEPIAVRGRIVAADASAVGVQNVTLWLGPSDARVTTVPLVHLGQALTDASGAFAASVVVPVQQRVGDWGVYASWQGSATVRSAVSD